MMGSVFLRMGFWLLLTADLGFENIAIGLLASLLIPRPPHAPVPFRKWRTSFWAIIRALPLAYLQALQMMIWPHRETFLETRPLRSGRHPLMILMEIFQITFTPTTLALKVTKRRQVLIHHAARKKKP